MCMQARGLGSGNGISTAGSSGAENTSKSIEHRLVVVLQITLPGSKVAKCTARL